MPEESYVYLGDSARVPYGNKSAQTVTRFSLECGEFLCAAGVKLVVVACNTASAVALPALQAALPVPVIGMIDPAAAAAVRATRTGQIGVLGTRATINSDAYPAAIRGLVQATAAGQPVQVHSLACPLFVPLAEEGWIDHPASRLVAQEYLNALCQEAGALDTLVLGCTHYPLLKPLIQELLPHVTLIDCGEHAAQVAQELLQSAPQSQAVLPGTRPQIRFCLTDVPPTFAPIAQRFLGFPVESVERVAI
jgi:glutamate racemase